MEIRVTFDCIFLSLLLDNKRLMIRKQMLSVCLPFDSSSTGRGSVSQRGRSRGVRSSQVPNYNLIAIFMASGVDGGGIF